MKPLQILPLQVHACLLEFLPQHADITAPSVMRTGVQSASWPQGNAQGSQRTAETVSSALRKCLSTRLVGGSSMRRAHVRGAQVSMHRSCRETRPSPIFPRISSGSGVSTHMTLDTAQMSIHSTSPMHCSKCASLPSWVLVNTMLRV